MLDAGCDAIEIHTPQHDTLNNPELLQLIRQFRYRAIHTSDLHSLSQNHAQLEYYVDLAQKIDAAAITIHPHTMQHWAWLHEYFGNVASFENMDRFKPFGQTAHDMAVIAKECPGARWTFDINHVFTNDPSLKTVADFATLPQPGHYHISAFKDAQLPHTTLFTSNQDAIIQSVQGGAPIIIESLGLDDIDTFQKEYNYVKRVLGSRLHDK